VVGFHREAATTEISVNNNLKNANYTHQYKQVTVVFTEYLDELNFLKRLLLTFMLILLMGSLTVLVNFNCLRYWNR